MKVFRYLQERLIALSRHLKGRWAYISYRKFPPAVFLKRICNDMIKVMEQTVLTDVVFVHRVSLTWPVLTS